MIEYINGRPAATQEDLAGIISANTLGLMVSRGNAERARRACYERKALYYVDTLPEKYKHQVYHRFPDLQGQKEAITLMELMETDHEAHAFFAGYKHDGKGFTDAKVEELTNNCSILNACRRRLERSDEECLRAGGKRRIPRGEFWRKVADVLPRLADQWPHSLPGNPARLHEKYNQYMNDGPSVFISGKLGNKTAGKIVSDDQRSVMLDICKAGNNLDAAQAARMYNMVAKARGWKEVTSGTALNFIKKNGLYVTAGRRGPQEFWNTKAMQVTRRRPSGALLYWVHDGWTSELYYKGPDGFTGRMNLEVVLDPCCNYPIGYAISAHENATVIRDALGNALRHSRELFGLRFQPYEIQSDNYARTALAQVYTASCTHYVPAKVGNAKAKVIEPYFNYLNKNYAQYMKNWSGFGVKSRREVQPNPKWLDNNKHDFPTAEEVVKQITMIMEMERAAKREAFLAYWGQTAAEYRRVMSDETFLRIYGVEMGRHVLEGCGLRVTIEGERIAYDSFDIAFRKLDYLRWTALVDPHDLSHILAVSESGEYRFLLEQKYVQPMALADRKPGDAEQLQRIRDFNKSLTEHVAEVASEADAITQRIFDHNSELDNTLAKTIITDSRGQHKDLVSQKRLNQLKEARMLEAGKAAEEIDCEAVKMQKVPIPLLAQEEDEDFNRFDIY